MRVLPGRREESNLYFRENVSDTAGGLNAAHTGEINVQQKQIIADILPDSFHQCLAAWIIVNIRLYRKFLSYVF